jgi:hypothetical protein
MGVFGHVIKSTRSEEKVGQSMTNTRSAFQKYLNSHLELARGGHMGVFGHVIKSTRSEEQVRQSLTNKRMTCRSI